MQLHVESDERTTVCLRCNTLFCLLIYFFFFTLVARCASFSFISLHLFLCSQLHLAHVTWNCVRDNGNLCVQNSFFFRQYFFVLWNWTVIMLLVLSLALSFYVSHIFISFSHGVISLLLFMIRAHTRHYHHNHRTYAAIVTIVLMLYTLNRIKSFCCCKQWNHCIWSKVAHSCASRIPKHLHLWFSIWHGNFDESPCFSSK